jgi:hypothetical protein
MQAFDKIYEPSGVLQLHDGRLLIIEDEKEYPFSLLALDNKQGKQKTFKRLALKLSLKDSQGDTTPLNDLEGITQDNAGWIYAITSHSRNSKNKRKDEREQLVRFQIKNNRLSHYQIATSSLLMDALRTVLPQKKQRRKLNIEGLAYDQQREHLLLGLRAPLIDDKALLIRIKNPQILFKPDTHDALAIKKIKLDLNGQSIRSIEYNPILKAYLIVAGSVKDRGKPFQLWLWTANKLRAIDLSKEGSIGYTEGITAINNQDGKPALLLVQDDGQRGKSSGHYLFLSYDQLKID